MERNAVVCADILARINFQAPNSGINDASALKRCQTAEAQPYVLPTPASLPRHPDAEKSLTLLIHNLD